MDAPKTQKPMYQFMPELKALTLQFNGTTFRNAALTRALTHFIEACDPKTIEVGNSLRIARNELNFAKSGIAESDIPFYQACAAVLNGTAYAIN